MLYSEGTQATSVANNNLQALSSMAEGLEDATSVAALQGMESR